MSDNTPTDDDSPDFPQLPDPSLQGLSSPEGDESAPITTEDQYDLKVPPEEEKSDNTPDSPASSRLPSIGSLLKRTWAVFQRRIITLLALYIISIVMMVIPTALIMGGGYLSASFIPVAKPLLLAIIGLIAVSVGMWTMMWGTVALLSATIDDTLGIKGALSQSRSKTWGFIWLSFIAYIILIGSFMLLFIPGIIIMVILMPVTYVYLSEDIRGMDAILKSREYVRGNWLGVFARLIVLMLISIVISLIPVIGPLINLILMPFYLIYMYTIYQDLKDTKGDFDFTPTRKGKLGFAAIAVAGIIMPFVIFHFSPASNIDFKMMMQQKLMEAMMNQGGNEFDMGDFEDMEGFEGFEEFDLDDMDFDDIDFDDDGGFNGDIISVKRTRPEDTAVIQKPRPGEADKSAQKRILLTQEKVKPKKVAVNAAPKPVPKATIKEAPVIVSALPSYRPMAAWHKTSYSVEENIEILRDWSRPWIDRNEAARELGEASGADSVRALKRALEEDPESFVRREAALSLGKIGDANAVKVLTNATNNDDDEWVAKYAKEALSMIANPNKSVKRSTAPSTNEWVVNVASYTSRSEADATSEMLREMDFAPYITEFTLSGTLWYRVRVGFFKSRASADSTKSLIAQELKITDAWSVKAAPSELSRH